MMKNLFFLRCEDKKTTTIVGKIAKVSSDPKEVVSDADLIICGGPSHANPIYLQTIAPYVKEGAKIGGTLVQNL
jgi:glycerol-3-phosphate dehydrogenase